MPDDAKPNELQQQESIKEFSMSDEELFDMIKAANAEVDKIKTDRTGWAKKLVDNYKWRRGLVGKPYPSLPFRNSSDNRYRMSEKIIAKLAPTMVESALSPTHIVRIIAQDPRKSGSASKLEQFYDYFYKAETPDFETTIEEAVDQLLENDLCVAKTTYSYITEPRTITHKAEEEIAKIIKLLSARLQTQIPPKTIKEADDTDYSSAIAGVHGWDLADEDKKNRVQSILEQLKSNKEYIEVIEDVEVENRPKISNVADLTDVSVATTTSTLQEADSINHEFIMTERELLANSVENGGKYRHIPELLDLIKTRMRGQLHKTPVASQDKESITWGNALTRAEGLTTRGELEGFVMIRERYCHVKRSLIKRMKGKALGDDNTVVRAMVTYAPEVPIEDLPPLRIIEYPYNHGRWPFRECHVFSNKRRYYSGEGVPERVRSLEKEENISRNAAIDRTSITLSPPVFYYANSGITPQMHRQIGNWHPTQVPPQQAAWVMQYPDLSSGFKIDANEAALKADELCGVANMTALSAYSDAPTAQQVEQQVAPSQGIRQLMLRRFLSFLTGIYQDVFELHKQYMFTFKGNGKISFPNMDNPQESIDITEDDFNGDYIIMAGADLSRMNPVLQAQNEFVTFQYLTNAPQWSWAVNPYDGLYDFVSSRVGPMKARVWMKPKQEAEQSQQQFMMIQAQLAMKQAAGKRPRQFKPKQMPGASGGFTAAP